MQVVLVPDPSESRYWKKKSEQEQSRWSARVRERLVPLCFTNRGERFRANLVNVDKESRRVRRGVLDGDKLRAAGGDH